VVIYVRDVPDAAGSNLDAALKQFERVASTLEKAERVWADLAAGSLSSEDHEQRVRIFVDLVAALPAIDGFSVQVIPMSLTEMQLARFDAGEVGEPEFYVQTEERIDRPGFELRQYRHLFDAAWREIVRGRVREVVDLIDTATSSMAMFGVRNENAPAGDWEQLTGLVSELDRLLGDSTARYGRWSYLRRHLHFAEASDLHDIVDRDWPSVRSGLEDFVYDEFEPLPVQVDDLSQLVAARPRGPVSTALNWAALDATGFERLLYDLVGNEDGYENSNWLMRTNAADQGRDVEVYRVTVDPLSGTRRERVIVQCKHWTASTIGRNEIVLCAEAVQLWEPPRVDVLIVATTGRFSRDAVAWHERRDLKRDVPRIELWPDSHLEMLLARRPHLIATFGLR
jgi:hypothetical protein